MGIKTFPQPPYSPDLLPGTFGYSLSSEAVVMRQLRRWKSLWRRSLTQENFHGALQKLLERYNKCIAAGGDYLEGDNSFMCLLSIKVPIRKKSGNLFHDSRTYYLIHIVMTIEVLILLSSETLKVKIQNNRYLEKESKQQLVLVQIEILK